MSNKHNHRPPSGRTNLASCVVATIFLIFVVIVILIVFFTVFKPEDPKIAVSAVQLPSFAISNNTVNFTFSQYASVRNPNKAVFSHYDSSLQLLYSGSQVGFMFIPAGKIDAGHTQYMSATFAVQSFPLSAPANSGPVFANEFTGGADLSGGQFPGSGVPISGSVVPGLDGVVPSGGEYRLGPSLQIESSLEMSGRVRVLHLFSHHVKTKIGCRITVRVNDGSVLGFHC